MKASNEKIIIDLLVDNICLTQRIFSLLEELISPPPAPSEGFVTFTTLSGEYITMASLVNGTYNVHLWDKKDEDPANPGNPIAGTVEAINLVISSDNPIVTINGTQVVVAGADGATANLSFTGNNSAGDHVAASEVVTIAHTVASDTGFVTFTTA